MMLQRGAAAECLRGFKHHSCARNRCATIFGHSVRRYSIAHAVIQRPQRPAHTAPSDSTCQQLGMVPQSWAAAWRQRGWDRCDNIDTAILLLLLPASLVRADVIAAPVLFARSAAPTPWWTAAVISSSTGVVDDYCCANISTTPLGWRAAAPV